MGWIWGGNEQAGPGQVRKLPDSPVGVKENPRWNFSEKVNPAGDLQFPSPTSSRTDMFPKPSRIKKMILYCFPRHNQEERPQLSAAW